MTTKLKALYDFSGEIGSVELSIKAGEILTFIRDVGAGWYEGENSKGQVGLFPENYVEKIEAGPPSIPAPQLPSAYYEEPPGEEPWSSENNTNNTQQNQQDDFWDDDWDDDSETGQQPPTNAATAPVEFRQPALDLHRGYDTHSVISTNMGEKAPTAKKNFNRFSAFVKSGGESYILGTAKVHVSEADKVYIMDTGTLIMWNDQHQKFKVEVASPKKESKMRGLKSYIAYKLTPTYNGIQVSRRYKHFDWLHERLEEKFCLIPIPPLPDKQISGRYEEQFIEHRRVQLQLFVDNVCRHPVLSQSAVWKHFIECTDEKMWKMGKRRAEKDALVGANYFACLEVPEKIIDPFDLERHTENAQRFVTSMDNSVKNVMATALDQTKKCQAQYKREYQKIGQTFQQLGASFDLDNSSVNLTTAIKRTGDAYNNIGKMFEDQPKLDWEPLADQMHIYKGILASFPDILQVHKDAVNKHKEMEKVEQKALPEMKRRSDVMSYALLAEISQFHTQREEDFKTAMKGFLNEQINLYQNATLELRKALQFFEEAE
ncbi:sorting nexin lst-4 [Neocloeon triangulifer]|uniref:sorting nexin lst-4 n=1 Tax=Neocloeon triangulifer TaxID=2078957 RepID=UPI00286F7910|nr:sorting nexin lst-4 [Neocloeon triangulifer]